MSPDLRIHDDDLSYGNDPCFRLFQGKPFSGIAFTTYSTGTVETEMEYVNGIAQGIHRSWWPSGKPALEATLEGEVYHGAVKHYSEEGELVKEEVFEYGFLLVRRERNARGELEEIFRMTEKSPNFKPLQAMRKAREEGRL